MTTKARHLLTRLDELFEPRADFIDIQSAPLERFIGKSFNSDTLKDIARSSNSMSMKTISRNTSLILSNIKSSRYLSGKVSPFTHWTPDLHSLVTSDPVIGSVVKQVQPSSLNSSLSLLVNVRNGTPYLQGFMATSANVNAGDYTVHLSANYSSRGPSVETIPGKGRDIQVSSVSSATDEFATLLETTLQAASKRQNLIITTDGDPNPIELKIIRKIESNGVKFYLNSKGKVTSKKTGFPIAHGDEMDFEELQGQLLSQ